MGTLQVSRMNVRAGERQHRQPLRGASGRCKAKQSDHGNGGTARSKHHFRYSKYDADLKSVGYAGRYREPSPAGCLSVKRSPCWTATRVSGTGHWARLLVAFVVAQDTQVGLGEESAIMLFPMPAPSLFILFVLLVTTGCPEGKRSELSSRCTKLHEQCLLPPSGPLGVCNETDCLPGQAPPCLKCVSQH